MQKYSYFLLIKNHHILYPKQRYFLDYFKLILYTFPNLVPLCMSCNWALL